MRSVATVAPNPDGSFGRFENERCPKSLVFMQVAARKMPCRSRRDLETALQLRGIPPVHFQEFFDRVVPVLQMRTHAKCRNYLFNPWLHFRDNFVIQMIPMVMGDDKVIDVRHIDWLVDVRTLEHFIREFYGSPLVKHRIHQDLFPGQVQQIRRMPEPY